MKKLIFLDVDGVLNCCTADMERLSGLGLSDTEALTCISPFAADRLIEICRRTGAHIVLNASMGPDLFSGNERIRKDRLYCLPDGRCLMGFLKDNGAVVDGYAFDRWYDYRKKRTAGDKETVLTGSKLAAAALYLSAHPAERFIFIEDGLSFDREDILKDEELLGKYAPEALPCYDAGLFQRNYIATKEQDIWSVPYGLRDCDIEKAVRLLA